MHDLPPQGGVPSVQAAARVAGRSPALARCVSPTGVYDRLIRVYTYVSRLLKEGWRDPIRFVDLVDYTID
jgi:hypothetical protein